MAHTYWYKQSPNTPLFPDLLWSRPQNKQHAGKLLIVGGNKYGFAAPAEAYEASMAAGIGVAQVLLPVSVKKIAGSLLPNIEYAPSNPSGSFSQEALGELLLQAQWADGVLFAGDLGHNSETAIMLEAFLSKHSGRVSLTQDALEYCLSSPKRVINRPDTLLVLTMAQLQKLAINAGFTVAFQLSMDLLYLVEGLHDFTSQYPLKLIVKHLDQMVVALNGNISTTRLEKDLDIWRVKTAATANVWWIQNLDKPFESLTTAVAELK